MSFLETLAKGGFWLGKEIFRSVMEHGQELAEKKQKEEEKRLRDIKIFQARAEEIDRNHKIAEEQRQKKEKILRLREKCKNGDTKAMKEYARLIAEDNPVLAKKIYQDAEAIEMKSK